MGIATASKITGIVCMIFFFALLAGGLIRYGSAFLPKLTNAPSKPQKRALTKKVLLTVLIAFAASRLFFLLSGMLYAFITGELSTYLAEFGSRMVRWDAHHYLRIAEDWYVNVGDDKFKIVFLPLYPLIMRGIMLLGLSSRAAAYIVSNGCLIASGVLLFALINRDHGRKHAYRGVWLLMFCPMSFIFSAAFSESLFLMLTLLSVWFARRGKFALAIAAGALCTFTRLLGLAIAVPIFYEMLRREYEGRLDGAFAKRFGICVLKTSCVALGFLAYLGVNLAVTGNALTFFKYQAEHWSQTFGSLAYTVEYTMNNALTFGDIMYRFSLWAPQLICIISTLILFAVTIRRLNAGDLMFGLVYFYCAVAPTWLLSGTRYIAAMYALYPMLALISRGRWKFRIALGISALAGGYMFIMYSIIGLVL